MADSFKERATPLLERGFSVIPLMPREKKPVAGMGVTKKSRNQDVIDTWAAQWPEANVAVCADDTFLILDADDAAAMLEITGPLNTYTVESSPGKAHYYFRRDPKAFNYIRNLEMGKVGSLRAANQYVVGAGSIHPKTGDPYTVVNDAPIAIIDAGLFHKLEQVALVAEREIERIRANWDGKTKIATGMRQYFLTSQAGKLQDGTRTEEQIFAELLAINNKFCDPPKSESEISRLASWAITLEPNKQSDVKLVFGSQEGAVTSSFKYQPTTKPTPAARGSLIYGLFKRGAVNILHGPSGVGKTRLLLEMEDAARQGRAFFSERGNARPDSILYLLRDRPMEDHEDTLKDMGLPTDFVRAVELPAEGMDAAAAKAIVEAIEANPVDLTVVEGLDECISSLIKRDRLIPFLKVMQQVTKHTGTCLVGTWGAPKRQSNPKDMYHNSRDAASGGGDVSRMCNTMVGLSFEYAPHARGEMNRRKTGRVHVSIDLRGKPDARVLSFTCAGRMVECGVRVEIDPGAPEEMSYEQIQELAGMSKATFYRHRASNSGEK